MDTVGALEPSNSPIQTLLLAGSHTRAPQKRRAAPGSSDHAAAVSPNKPSSLSSHDHARAGNVDLIISL